jgi:hypothetical protein
MKKIVFEKAPAELKFVGVESENGWKAIVVKDYKIQKYRLIDLANGENLPEWGEKTIDEIISESKKFPSTTPYSFTSNTDLVNWAMGDDSVQKFPILETTDTIHIDDVTDEMYVGIVWPSGHKSFIIRTDSGFAGYEANSAMNKNKRWSKPTLKEYLLGAGCIKSAHVFPTAKELLQWTITD